MNNNHNNIKYYLYLCTDECVSLEEFRQNLQGERDTGGSSHCGLFICVFFLVFGDTPQSMGGSPLFVYRHFCQRLETKLS